MLEEASKVNELPASNFLPVNSLQEKVNKNLSSKYIFHIDTSLYCLFMLTVAGNTYFSLKSLFILLSNFPFQ